jgi:hypothetical protein
MFHVQHHATERIVRLAPTGGIMSAVIAHRPGDMEDYAPEKIPQLVAELDAYADGEHPDISVSHANGWTLSAFPSGLVVWESVEDDTEPRHLRNVSREQLVDLLLLCGQGEHDQLKGLPWHKGYGH